MNIQLAQRVAIVIIVVAATACILLAILYDINHKPLPPLAPVDPVIVQPDKPTPEPEPPCPGPCPCKKIKVLAFTAPWCQPCREAKPKLIEAQKRGLDVQIINIDLEPALARQYAISSVPTFVICKDGKETRTQDVAAVMALIL